MSDETIPNFYYLEPEVKHVDMLLFIVIMSVIFGLAFTIYSYSLPKTESFETIKKYDQNITFVNTIWKYIKNKIKAIKQKMAVKNIGNERSIKMRYNIN
jgi:hypothetical protein